MTRWRTEAAALGWTPDLLVDAIRDAVRDVAPVPGVTVAEVLDRLSTNGSTWARADVVRAICDVAAAPAASAQRWAAVVERAADEVVQGCANLDPTDTTTRRREGDGRSVWIEPVAPRPPC
jgi:hypothetical protein